MVKNTSTNTGDIRDTDLILKLGRSSGEDLFLPGESHGKRRLEGYRPTGSQRVGNN